MRRSGPALARIHRIDGIFCRMPIFRCLILAGLLLVPCALTRGGDDWPQFRGPTGLGYTAEKDLPLKWDGKTGENILWKADLPGEGHASPIVWQDRVFTCTVTWSDDPDERKRMPDHHVTCYRAADGKQLWDTKVKPGLWVRNDFRSGSGGGYAAPTPCTDGKLVFAAFGSAVLVALDFDGNVTWRKDLVPHTFDVTVGSSPVLFGDTVILLCAMAQKNDSRLVAFDKNSGEVRWETKLPTLGFAHSTPLIIDVNGKPQMLVVASAMGVTPDGLQSFDPASGKRLWWCRGGGDASSPAYGGGIVYFDSGRGGPGFAVDPTGASGDVSATHVKWGVPKLTEAIGSPVIVDGYLYRLQTPNVLRCFKLEDGQEVYSKPLAGIGSTWASPIADGSGHLIFANGGKSYVLKTGPEFEVVAVNDLNDPNHATAAVAGGKLFIEGRKRLYCVGKK
jgi:outer membrane protein assembly factor BamB